MRLSLKGLSSTFNRDGSFGGPSAEGYGVLTLPECGQRRLGVLNVMRNIQSIDARTRAIEFKLQAVVVPAKYEWEKSSTCFPFPEIRQISLQFRPLFSEKLTRIRPPSAITGLISSFPVR